MSLNDVDFTGRMQAGRDHAARERHLGRNAGRPKYAKPAPLEDTPENRLIAHNAALSSQVRDLENQLAQIRLNGGELEPIDDAGAEFDRLFASAKSEGQACRPAPLSPQHSTTAARPRGTHTMTKNQYLAALKKLGLSPSSRATAAALGLTVRQCQRLAAGDSPIPETVALLLAMYLEHGLPESDDE